MVLPTLDSCKEDEHNAVKEPARSLNEGCSSRMISCDVIKNEVLCAICLGILKNTVTSQECLHRFCRECIRTSLKVGNQRCPTCRAPLTESNLRADPVFDNLVQKLFPQTQNSDANQSEKKDHSLGVSESQEKDSQDAICKNNALKENPQNTLKDGCKEEKVIEDAYVCLSNDSKELNVNQPHLQDSGLHVTTPKEELIGKPNTTDKKKIARRCWTPERRSVRLKALKIECEKNASETYYNTRLSNGCAHIFFLSLRLRPNNMEDMDDACCCTKDAPREDKNSSDQKVEQNKMARTQEKESDTNKKQEVFVRLNDVENDITEYNVGIVKEGGAKTYKLGKEEHQKTSNKHSDESVDSYLFAENGKNSSDQNVGQYEIARTQKKRSDAKKQEEFVGRDDNGNEITESKVDIVIEDGEKTYDIAEDKRQKTSNKDSDQSIDNYLSVENAASKVPDIAGANIMSVASDKMGKHRGIVPIRRSERSAALIAQENIWRQTASRKRLK